MKINTNVPALKAYTSISKTERDVARASNRLSSGLKISSAKDDPAGRAVSNKLRVQAKGLAKASQNASNGISAIQTAEGALNEIHAMLQRMNELCVYAANGTNTAEDVQKMQMEIDQIKDEIDKTALKTDFNKIKLLNGDADRISYSPNATILRATDNMPNATYKFDLVGLATKSTVAGAAQTPAGDPLKNVDGKVYINGVLVTFDKTDSNDSAFEKLRVACEASGLNITKPDPIDPNDVGKVFKSIEAKNAGSKYSIEIVATELDGTGNGQALLSALGLTAGVTKGDDIQIKLHTETYPAPADLSRPLTSNAAYSAEGNRVTVYDISGRTATIDIEDGLPVGTNYELMTIKQGPMYIQIGPSKNIEMEVKIPKITSKTLELDVVQVGSPTSVQYAMKSVEKAIALVSDVRAKLGAYQNRLEFTISNLDNNELNTTQALSRIVDADMAEEMMNYTKGNIIVQAGLSVMGQANQRPQSILQLMK